MLVFVLLDEHADNFHKRRKGVRFVFANFIDGPIEQETNLCGSELLKDYVSADFGLAER